MKSRYVGDSLCGALILNWLFSVDRALFQAHLYFVWCSFLVQKTTTTQKRAKHPLVCINRISIYDSSGAGAPFFEGWISANGYFSPYFRLWLPLQQFHRYAIDSKKTVRQLSQVGERFEPVLETTSGESDQNSVESASVVVFSAQQLRLTLVRERGNT